MPWTVSCFVKRDGSWERLVRVVDDAPDPLACEAAMYGVTSKAVSDRLRAAVHELLGVQGEYVQGEMITAGSGLPFWTLAVPPSDAP